MENDDIESYLVIFKSIMEAHKIEDKSRTQFLAPNLTGKAQQAFAALPAEEAAQIAVRKERATGSLQFT